MRVCLSPSGEIWQCPNYYLNILVSLFEKSQFRMRMAMYAFILRKAVRISADNAIMLIVSRG